MYSAILLSGGTGTRMRKDIPKQYLLLGGKPMIIHTIERFDRLDAVDEIVIVCAPEYEDSLKLMVHQYNVLKNVIFAESGETRQASVYSGLKASNQADVIIHEAARPFATIDDFERLIASENRNAILGYDIPFTVVKGHDEITGILDRSELVNVQLPQKFEKSLLIECHEMAVKEKKYLLRMPALCISIKRVPLE